MHRKALSRSFFSNTIFVKLAAVWRVVDQTRILLAVIGIVGAAGCTVEYPYLCISLERVAGMEIDKAGPVGFRGLRGGAVVPLEYSLARAAYTLHFSVIQESAHPAVRVAVTGSSLSLKFHRDMGARAPNGTPCASFYILTESAFNFGWAGECIDPQLSKAFEFDVINANDEVVARERIEFELRENGSYIVTDSI